MNFWLDLFTGITWNEFRNAGANVSGFTAHQKSFASKVKPDDIFLCYLVKVQLWVGALRVLGVSQDIRPIWKDNEFPTRFDVEPIIMLDAECGIPMESLSGKVAFFQGPADKGKYRGFLRGSPRRFERSEDGTLILNMLKQAERNPTKREVDPKKLAYRPKGFFEIERKVGKKKLRTRVSVPEEETPSERLLSAQEPGRNAGGTEHTEVQFLLLTLGAEMGFDVWVARNDKTRQWNGQALGKLPRMLDALPTQFNEATQRTVELIDVLWLKGNQIVAAFEVECTTSIYSGLLRMSDLMTLHPNFEIKFYLVAADERRDKVRQEINRPTFKLRAKPLEKICAFLPLSKLRDRINQVRELEIIADLKPEFLDKLAEYYS